MKIEDFQGFQALDDKPREGSDLTKKIIKKEIFSIFWVGTF